MNRAFVLSLVGLIATAVATIGAAQTSPPPARSNDAPQTRQADPIDMARARQLFQRRQRGEKLTDEETAYLERALAARRNRQQPGAARPAIAGQERTGFKPLTEMTAEDRYKDQDGGLYGQGRNTPPEPHQQAALKQAEIIQPLDAEGKPDESGRIVLVSISMSNATQEFSRFKRIADADADKSPRLTIVDCAQGGQAMAEWTSPQARPWQVAMQRIDAAGVTPQQVQVAWIKLANKSPQGDLQAHGKKLQEDTLAVIQNAKVKFPNLRIAYLSSRIYAGYATGGLNPEPYAYESAYVVRWLIQDQLEGDPALNYDPKQGAVKAPLLLWGPYLWADGTTPRKGDNLLWKREDLANDGVHPSESGRDKVAHMLLDFFETDETAKPWFTR
jgi:hypothetical protein